MKMSLQEELRLPPNVRDGRMDVHFKMARFPFAAAIKDVLVQNGLVHNGFELDQSHEVIEERHRLPDPVTHDSLATKLVSDAFVADSECRRVYRRFVSYLAREVLGYDVVFQRCPTFRFLYPAKILPEMRGPKGELLAYHHDQVFGDPVRQINCWLPLTAAFGTNAMMVANFAESVWSLEQFCASLGFDRSRLWKSRRMYYEYLRDNAAFRDRVTTACSPLVTDYGTVHLFDGRFLHGTSENSEALTRVSADFRLLSVKDYAAMIADGRTSFSASENDQHEGFVKGDFYDAMTAYELDAREYSAVGS